MRTTAKLRLLATCAVATVALEEVMAAATDNHDPEAIELAVIADIALEHVRARAWELLEDDESAELDTDPDPMEVIA